MVVGIDVDDDPADDAGAAGGIRTVSIRYSVALAVLMPPQTTPAPPTIRSLPDPVTLSELPSTVAVSYTHLTLPTKRIV